MMKINLQQAIELLQDLKKEHAKIKELCEQISQRQKPTNATQ